jgi:hypothetical protein
MKTSFATSPGEGSASPELLPFLTLQEASGWLMLRGIQKSPKGLIAAAMEGRLQVFAAVPEGACHGLISTGTPSAKFMASLAEFAVHPEFQPVTPGRTFQINEGREFKRGEMVAVSPDDCVQFLQTGEAHIRENGGQEWIDAGMPRDAAILMVVRDISAFRVKGCDLEAFADAVTPASAPSISRPDVSSTRVPPDRELKKVALVQLHAHSWRSINGDFGDAVKNGLRAAAGGTQRGWWWECAALEWARARGKLIEATQVPATVFNMGRKKG